MPQRPAKLRPCQSALPLAFLVPCQPDCKQVQGWAAHDQIAREQQRESPGLHNHRQPSGCGCSRQRFPGSAQELRAPDYCFQPSKRQARGHRRPSILFLCPLITYECDAASLSVASSTCAIKSISCHCCCHVTLFPMSTWTSEIK